MFGLTTTHRYLLYSQPTDMRKSFDSLSGLIQNHLGANPRSGQVYIFINKRRDKVKLLHWTGVSYVLYYKRLEQGSFELPCYDAEVGSITIKYSQLVLLIDGLSIKNMMIRKAHTAAI